MPGEKKNWWELLGWNDQQRVKRLQLAHSDTAILGTGMGLSWFNPDCKHERCSYDILTCPKCIEYTKQKNAEHAKQTTPITSTS
jgi:hypothetical protein